MPKYLVRTFLFIVSLFFLYCSIFLNKACIQNYGTFATQLIYLGGILVLIVVPVYPDGGPQWMRPLVLMKSQTKQHNELVATLAGVLLFIGFVSLLSLLISTLALILIHGNASNENFFATIFALSLIMSQNVGMGMLLTWLLNQKTENTLYAKIPFTEKYYLIGEERKQNNIEPNHRT